MRPMTRQPHTSKRGWFSSIALPVIALTLAALATIAATTQVGAATDDEPEFIGRFTSDPDGTSEGRAEIVSYDADSKQLFITNAEADTLDIVSLPDFELVKQVSMEEWGAGLNSVSVSNGVVAVAVEADPKSDPGSIVFLDTNGSYLSSVGAGALPDMITFTPDGGKVVVANEGEPNDDECGPDGEGFAVDPEGSITVVDFGQPISVEAAKELTDSNVHTASFSKYNDQKEALLDKGIRIFVPGATVAQDLEPEYVAVSRDSGTAYVTLQENNAIAVVDLASAEVTDLLPLGTVDFSTAGHEVDPSDKDDKFELRSVPVQALFLPDAIATFSSDGTAYLATANEGDSRDYDCYSEEVRLGDPADEGGLEFPADSELATRTADEADLGRLLATNAFPYSADEPETVYAFSPRSFSIWSTDGKLLWDSGADMTRRVLDDPVLGEGFQGQTGFDDETENWTGWEPDSRSDDKGVEAEAITVGEICGVQQAFIGFERQSAIAQYDLSDPTSPAFVRFISSANYDWEGSEPGSQVIDPEAAGDISPEGVIFISAEDSPDGRPWVVAAHELSGSTAAWALPATCDSTTNASETGSSVATPSTTTPDVNNMAGHNTSPSSTGSTAAQASTEEGSGDTATSNGETSDTTAASSSSVVSLAGSGSELAHTGPNSGWLALIGAGCALFGLLLAHQGRDSTPIVGDEL